MIKKLSKPIGSFFCTLPPSLRDSPPSSEILPHLRDSPSFSETHPLITTSPSGENSCNSWVFKKNKKWKENTKLVPL